MKSKKTNLPEANLLRQKAEELFKKKQEISKTDFIDSEKLKLIHELEVHQIELEMQNEELIIAREKAEIAQKKYTDLYDFAPLGYLTLSKKGIITDLNFEAAQMLCKERFYLLNQSFDNFISNNFKASFNNFFKNVFLNNVKQSCEIMMVPCSFESIYMHIDGVHDQSNEFCHLTLTDITQKKEDEKKLISAKIKAETSERLKSAFLANISHEIRTPMNGILGFSELLKNQKLSSTEQQNYIRIIEKSGARLLNLINDIIVVSKIESETTKLHIKNTDINSLIKELYNFFKPETDLKKLKISFKNSLPDDEAFILTDPVKVHAVLTNLIKNAIKFTNEGSIEFGYIKKENSLEFYVKDTGIGIDKKYLSSIFERFYQVEIHDQMVREGSGLGLSIVSGFVEILGGKINIETEEAIGSTFYFTLPYNTEIKDKNLDNEIVSKLEKDNKINLKILIVEDDKASMILLSLLVENFSREILKAETGFEALELCRSNPDIDLVLMDIQMSAMSGYEATAKIREFNKDVIIIAQSAFAFVSDKEKALELGFNDYITKPIASKELQALIEKYFYDESILNI